VTFTAARHADVTEYNTLITPRARQEQLILADGTKVWLNAASSIRFPTAFSGKQRAVEITGEAYFEVAKDVAHPFIVKVRDIQVEVLGTHFNVMAYANERSWQTTLLEGAVRVTQLSRHRSQVIKPGEQVQINNGDGSFNLIPHADVRLATAWKDGTQAFHNADIATIMREVERWYDVNVVYQGEIPQRAFSGEIPRSASLTELLKLFEVNKIHFTIDVTKRELTVLP
jgi:ferric-dicitrate binding protein FerR (iron transport regulator)